MIRLLTDRSWPRRVLSNLAPGGHLSRQATGIALARLFQFGALIIVNAWLARALDKDVFGDYQKLWIVNLAISPLLLMGMPQSINVFLPKAPLGKRGGILVNFLVFQSIVALPAMAIFWIKPELIAQYVINAPHLAPLIPLIGLYLFIVLPTFYMESLCVVENKIGFFFRVFIIHSVLFTVGHIVASIGGELRPLVWCIIIVMLVRLGFTIWLAARLYAPFEWRINHSLQRKISTYSFPLLLTAILDVLTIHTDKFIVMQSFSSDELATYTLGAIEVPIIFFLISAVTSVMIPALAKSDDRELYEHYVRVACGRLALVLIPFFFFSLACTDFVIPLVFSQRYEGTVAIFMIYLFLIPQRALHVFPLLLTKNQKKHILIGRVIDVVSNIGLALALIPFFGLWGPAIAVVIATHLNKFYFIIIVRRNLGMRLTRLAPWGFLSIVTLLSAGLGAAMYYIRMQFEIPWIGFIIGSAIFAGVAVPLILKERNRAFH